MSLEQGHTNTHNVMHMHLYTIASNAQETKNAPTKVAWAS